MIDQPPRDLMLVKLEEIRLQQEATNAKIGSLAQTLVGVQKDILLMKSEIARFGGDLAAIKDNVATLAIAMDAHTDRLDHIEQRLGIGIPPN